MSSSSSSSTFSSAAGAAAPAAAAPRGSASDGNAASDALELLASGGNHLLDVLTLELLDQEGGALGVGVDIPTAGALKRARHE
jgi:hypothetical protein